MNKICTCHESEKTGQISVMCCNKCGLPDEDFWQPPTSQSEGVSAEGVDKQSILDHLPADEESHREIFSKKEVFDAMEQYASSLLREKEDEIQEMEHNDKLRCETYEQLQAELDKYKELVSAAEKLIHLDETNNSWIECYKNYQQLKQSIQ